MGIERLGVGALGLYCGGSGGLGVGELVLNCGS